ncbi:MAG: uroporphyrinogen decarboxylase [Pikeienuella sp.]
MRNQASRKPLLRVLARETLNRPPIWLMRQAGRYLPEYRETRAKAGGFLDLCYNPELAAEVTLQPIRRFGFDAAILFADILLLPQALGQKLWFEPGEGPRLEPVSDISRLRVADEIHDVLSPIYETVRIVRQALPEDVTLIGFAGAPWTVATYMIAGKGTPDQAPAHELMKQDPEAFDGLIDRIVDGTTAYLSRQIEAGAEVVKLFDSWAGSLVGEAFERASVQPCRRIVEALKIRHPHVPVIGFPRGAGAGTLRFAEAAGVDCIAVGQDADLFWVRDVLQKSVPVQGNLDPGLLISGGEALERATMKTMDILSGGPHIFNLGHGITPDADPRHVERLVRLVKG